jgi:hypothetical protein
MSNLQFLRCQILEHVLWHRVECKEQSLVAELSSFLRTWWWWCYVITGWKVIIWLCYWCSGCVIRPRCCKLWI